MTSLGRFEGFIFIFYEVNTLRMNNHVDSFTVEFNPGDGYHSKNQCVLQNTCLVV